MQPVVNLVDRKCMGERRLLACSPYVLPAGGTASDGLTVYTAAAGQYGLQIGLAGS